MAQKEKIPSHICNILLHTTYQYHLLYITFSFQNKYLTLGHKTRPHYKMIFSTFLMLDKNVNYYAKTQNLPCIK
jgi:hypothetical protein